MKFQFGFPVNWHQLFLEHVDTVKMTLVTNILSGELPPTSEVLQMREYILAQMKRYRIANAPTPTAKDAQQVCKFYPLQLALNYWNRACRRMGN